jgi:ubiquitin-activating enzyme E1
METDLSKNAAFMDLYSRQIGAFGIETMGKLINMRVIIVGMKGVGIEIAKNLILAGPGSVVLCDDGLTEVNILLHCFFLTMVLDSRCWNKLFLNSC